MNKDLILGATFLITSACIYTAERFLAIFSWAAEVVPVKINGSGTYKTWPSWPNLTDNIFVLVFLVLGALLLVKGYIKNFSGLKINLKGFRKWRRKRL